MEQKKIDCAVALKYILGTKAPIITAVGRGDVANRIKKIAEKNKIEIVENTELANVLVQHEIGECIPEYVYSATAAIFAFLNKYKNTSKK